MADGSLAQPEVELVDEFGKVYNLSQESMGEDGIAFGLFDPASHLENLPRDRTFPTVRIRSALPIECSMIQWTAYNFRDRK